jgi:hypothetical protein
MNSRLQAVLVQWCKDHPVIAGLIFLAIGGYMTYDSIQKAAPYAQYVDGIKVIGTVVQLRDDVIGPQKYAMRVRWEDAQGNRYSSQLPVYESDYAKLERGSAVQLVMAQGDHAQAVDFERIRNHEPVSLFGIVADPLIYAGLGMGLGGLIFIGVGVWPKRKPAPRRSLAQRPPAARPSPGGTYRR